MTAFSPYQPYPGPAPAPPPVLLAVAPPAPQRRVTVAFRLILAVPHLFLLYWVFYAGVVVVVIGWWGALFTGRLPRFAVTFLSGILRWTVRVWAYSSLLTDVYPPFTLEDDPTYPVRVAIPEPQRLNRAAVLFRYFLALPVGILGGVLIYGAYSLIALIAWLIALVTGQLPPSLHLAYVALVRFQARYIGYFWMLTPAYPGGLYGDRPGAAAWADALPAAPAPGFGTPAPGFGTAGPGFGTAGPAYGTADGAYGAPADVPQGYEATQIYGAPQAYGQAPGYGAPPQGPAPGYGPAAYGAPAPGYAAPAGYPAQAGYSVRPLFQPATWLLPLTSGARKLMTTFIVLGALVLIGPQVAATVIRTVHGTVSTVNAVHQLDTSYTTLSNSLGAWEQATTDCDKQLACVTRQDGTAAGAFDTFSAQLAGVSVPSGAAAGKARLSADAALAARDFTQLSKTTTDSQYQATVSSTGLQQTLDRFDQDFNALVKNLKSY